MFLKCAWPRPHQIDNTIFIPTGKMWSLVVNQRWLLHGAGCKIEPYMKVIYFVIQEVFVWNTEWSRIGSAFLRLTSWGRLHCFTKEVRSYLSLLENDPTAYFIYHLGKPLPDCFTFSTTSWKSSSMECYFLHFVIHASIYIKIDDKSRLCFSTWLTCH